MMQTTGSVIDPELGLQIVTDSSVMNNNNNTARNTNNCTKYSKIWLVIAVITTIAICVWTIAQSPSVFTVAGNEHEDVNSARRLFVEVEGFSHVSASEDSHDGSDQDGHNIEEMSFNDDHRGNGGSNGGSTVNYYINEVNNNFYLHSNSNNNNNNDNDNDSSHNNGGNNGDSYNYNENSDSNNYNDNNNNKNGLMDDYSYNKDDVHVYDGKKFNHPSEIL